MQLQETIRPQMDKAYQFIMTCRRRADGVLDLSGLDLDDKAILALIPHIVTLPPLKELYLGRSSQTRGKPFFALSTLEKSKGNRLTTLPPELFPDRHRSLQRLDLSFNLFTEVPNSIAQLAQLKILWMDKNRISNLTGPMFRLGNLENLSVCANQIAFLPPTISNWTKLRALWLDTNRLQTFPEELGQLKSLETLSAGGNRLVDLPEAMEELDKLETLSLPRNALTALPHAFGNLKALQSLWLDGNPLVYPPPEIVRQGAQPVVDFISRAHTDGEPLFEGKLVLVGDPGHGKTALCGWLQHGEFIKPETTRGGEIGWRDSDVEHKGNRVRGRINIWDFGGQDRYRPVQQPLFTPGALYVLVCKGRENLDQTGAPQWLRLIQLRAGREAPVLLVFSHMGLHDGCPGVTGISDDLRPMIKGTYAIDSPTGYGIDQLVERIELEIQQLPSFGNKWPKRDIRARDAILTRRPDGDDDQRNPYLRYADFLAVCRPLGVSGAAARTLATASSLQGRIDYKGNALDPDQLVILNPEWLLKATAYIVDEAKVRQNNGILHHNWLGRIWWEHGRPDSDKPLRVEEDLWPDVLKLLASHELLFRLTDHEWVVPQLVSDKRPDVIPWLWEEDRAIALHCELDYSMPGLMAFLTVRHHYKHVDGERLFWDRGAFLRHPHSRAEALITVDGEKTIRMQTRGPGNDWLMADLSGTLERLIFDRWPGAANEPPVPFRFYVPCPTHHCRGRFGLGDLHADMMNKKVRSDCVDGGRHSHDIAKLLHGIELSDTSIEIRRMGLATQTYGQPPRAIEITPAEKGTLTGKVKNLAKHRARIQIYCELSENAVEDAVDAVEVDKEWWAITKDWLPWVAGPLAAILFGESSPVQDTFKQGTRSADRQVGELPQGKLVRPDGEILPRSMADMLIAIANKGKMRQTQLSSGRWVWASAAEADRNDPNVPKER